MSLFHAGFAPDGPVVRVRFGRGARLDLHDELRALGVCRALVLTTPGQAPRGEEIVAALAERACGLFSGATMHTPVEVTDLAMKVVDSRRPDCIVAIGGGSTIGLGKAIAYRSDLPQIVLPTTYAGSEATPVLGQTENGVKNTLSSPRVQPEAVVYDPELLTTLPVAISVESGLNAMAHAVEALYARDANPLSGELARAGIRAFVAGLPRVVGDPGDPGARADTLFGAWLCGTVLATAGMALHHKLCHLLGGTLNLPHATTHAIILPHAAAYNEDAAKDALAPVADALGADRTGTGLWDFARRLGAPTALRDLGVTEADLDRVADLAVGNPYWNPRPVERDGIRALLRRAWAGARPE